MFTFISGPKALGGILDHRDITLATRFIDGIHRRALPVKTDWHDGFGAGGDSPLDLTRVQIVGLGANVKEDWRGTQKDYRLSGGDERERCGDHLIAGPDPQGHQGQKKRIRSTGNRDAVLHADILGQSSFKFGHFRTKDVLPMAQHITQSLVDQVPDL